MERIFVIMLSHNYSLYIKRSVSARKHQRFSVNTKSDIVRSRHCHHCPQGIGTVGHGTPGTAGSDFVEGLGEVGEDVVDVLGADAEADGTGVDGLLGLLLGGELRVGGRGGMDYEALDVGYVGKE